MDRKIIITLCIGILLFLSGSSKASVDVNIGINVPLPPPFTFSVEPDLVVIPGTYAYFAPDAAFDIVFYGGYWWRPHGGYWYRSHHYNGPWNYIVARSVPRYIIRLPHDYRRIYYRYPRIPYFHVHKHWNRWEREKYWDRRHWKHEEREWRRDHREQRHDRREMRHDRSKEKREFNREKDSRRDDNKERGKNKEDDRNKDNRNRDEKNR
jgi:hypothetical protein